jgi:CTP synthase (UTP-ammonia lyase)
VETTTLAGLVAERLAGYSGFWCVPASPYRSTEGALAAIRFARETGRAFLGTCGGFQHALLEYARNELGLEEAGHPEIDPDTPLPLLAPLACELVEQSAKVRFTPGSLLRRIYGTVEAKEIYHCRYGLNPAHVSLLLDGRMRIAATDAAGEVRAVELRSHPFFLATAYQPERAALRGSSHPVVEAFVRASTRALQVE